MSRISEIIKLTAEPMAVSAEFERAVMLAVAMGLESGGSRGLCGFGSPMAMLDGMSGAVRVMNTAENRPPAKTGASDPFSVLYTRVPAGQAPAAPGQPSSVAVIDVYGPLMSSNSDVVDEDGNRFGTSYQFIRQAVHTARADGDVKAVLMRYDSPGGAAIGMHPAGAELFDLAHGDGDKVNAGSGFVARVPIVAYAERLMASAALGLGVQANAVLVAPAAITGSIGTISTFPNIAGLLDRWGIKMEAIKNPVHKDAGSPYRAMSDDDRARLQSTIDTFAGKFRADVARGRRVGAETVNGWVSKMIFVGGEAVSAGLADGQVVNVEQAIRAAAALGDAQSRH